jgi:cell division protein FtsI (penicillin-binding protein 3)
MLLEDVIAHSSNVGTIKLALQLGPDRLNAYLERFRYGEATTLGFPGETSGVAPSAGRWRTSLPTMAIGQGVSATQLQLARAFAAVANDGVMVEPKLVAGWLDPDGGLHTTPASRTERVVSSRTASQLRPMFANTVSDGTGSRGSIPGYAAGGKTGTAQKIAPGGGYSGHIASFVGFVPVEDPQLVIAVSIDEPFPIWGGVVAAPVFAEVGQAAVRILRIPPQAVVPEGAGVQAAGGIDAG